jgi:hypothetical protein
MCAATAGPVSSAKVRFHSSVAPVADAVAVAANVPRAPATLPSGGGTSCAASRVDASRMLVAWPAPLAPTAASSAAASARTAALEAAIFFTTASLP